MIYYYLMRITAWIPEERPRSKNLNVVIKVWSCLSMWFTVVDGACGFSCGVWFLWRLADVVPFNIAPSPRANAEATEYKARASGNRKSSQNI